MKKTLLISILFLLVLPSFAQLSNAKVDIKGLTTPKQIMKKLVSSLELGIFERSISQDEITKTASAIKKNSYYPFHSIHKQFYRFSEFGTIEHSKSDSNYLYSIGKVFISERYRELDYRKTHKDPSEYKNDMNGFFYYCKLYYHLRYRQYRIIIYPDFVQNICKPFMHFNRKSCHQHEYTNAGRAKNGYREIHQIGKSVHDNSIRALIEIPDAISEDFMINNSLSAKERLKKTKEDIVQLQEDARKLVRTDSAASWFNLIYMEWNATKAKFWDQNLDWISTMIFNLAIVKNSTLKVGLNLSKNMKVFELDFADPLMPLGLNITYSKNRNNEDFSYQAKYNLKFIRFNDIAADPGEIFIQSSDKGFINLVTSKQPDDIYLTGMDYAYRRLPVLDFKNQFIKECLNQKDYYACYNFKKDSLNKKGAAIQDNKNYLNRYYGQNVNNIKVKDEKIIGYTKQIGLLSDTLQSIEPKLNKSIADTSKYFKNLDSLFVSLQNINTIRNDSLALKLQDFRNVFLNSNIQLDNKDLPKHFFDNKYMDSTIVLNDNKLSIQGFGEEITLDSLKIKINSLVNKKESIKKSNVDRIKEDINSISNKIDKLRSQLKNLTNSLHSEKTELTILQNNNKLLKDSLTRASDAIKVIQNSDPFIKDANNYYNIFLQDKLSVRQYFVYFSSEEFYQIKRYNEDDSTGINKDSASLDDYDAKASPNAKKVRYWYQKFSKPFYVRSGLPISTSTFSNSLNQEYDKYLKNQICEIYQPYNINKKLIKRIRPTKYIFNGLL